MTDAEAAPPGSAISTLWVEAPVAGAVHLARGAGEAVAVAYVVG
ncbi:hypothetical protein AB0D40_31440 [Streptomyces massasporeus]